MPDRAMLREAGQPGEGGGVLQEGCQCDRPQRARGIWASLREGHAGVSAVTRRFKFSWLVVESPGRYTCVTVSGCRPTSQPRSSSLPQSVLRPSEGRLAILREHAFPELTLRVLPTA